MSNRFTPLLEEAGRDPRTLGSMVASSDYYYAETIYKMYSRDYNGSLRDITLRENIGLL